MSKPTSQKLGLFNVALKRLTALQGTARYAFATLGLMLLFVTTFVMTTTPKQAYATPPNTLNFQARLENASGAIVPDGTYNIEFKITNDPSTSDGGQGVCSGSCLWREDYLVSSSNGVRVVNGYLSVDLGSVTSFPVGMNWDQSLYLTMDIGATGSSPSWDVEMSPRLPLTGVPYAFQSKQAESLQDAQASFTGTLSFATLTGGNQDFVIADQAAAGTYDLLAAPSGSGYTGIGVELQSSTPGTAQNGNFNVNGTGLLTTLDATGSGTANTLTIGATTTSTGTITIGGSATTGKVTIGATGETGAITLGRSTATNTINIGNANTATGKTQTINIGAGTDAGTGKAIVTVGNTANASQTTIQAGTGGLLLQTGSVASGNSGDIYLQSGDASSGVAGNITIDTGSGSTSTTGSIEADGFESGTDSWASWFNSSIAQSASQAHSGADSLSVTTGTGSTSWGIQSTSQAVVAGQAYTFSAWIYLPSSDSISMQVSWGSEFPTVTTVTVPANTWTKLSGTLIAPVGATNEQLFISNNSSAPNSTLVAYLDDVAVTGGNTMPVVAIGANNAAGVVIGNANEAGSTTIQGGTNSTAIQLQASSGGTIGIANNAVAQTVNIGNTTGASAVNITAGTGRINLTTNSASSGTTVNTTTNSTSAFQVDNAAGDAGINVDTTTVNLVSNPSFEAGTTSWSANGGSTLSQNTNSSNVYYGNDSLAVALAATGTSGAQTSTFTGSTPAGSYTLSFFAKGSVALSGLVASLGTGTCTLNSSTVSSSTFNWYYCTVTTTSSSPTITITSTTNSATLYIDAVQLETGSSPTPYRAGKMAVEGSVVINGNQAQAASSLFALQVNELNDQQATGGGGVFIQGNSNDLYQNALVIAQANGNDQLKVNTTTGTTTITGGSSFWGTPAFELSESDAGEPAAVIEAASGQTADILRICSYSAATNCGTVLSHFDASGNLDIGGTPSGSDAPHLFLQEGTNDVYHGLEITNSGYNRTFYEWVDGSNIAHIDAGSTGNQTLALDAGNAGSGTGGVGIGTTNPGARLQINTNATGGIGEIIQGASGQTADLLDLNVNGVAVLNVASSGATDIATTNSAALKIQQASGGTTVLNVNSSAASGGASGAHLVVSWLSGDTDLSTPTSYFGSSNSSDNQIAIYAQNNGSGTSCSTYISNNACPAILGQSVNGNGVRGISSTSVGVVGIATSGLGVYGFSSSNAGVFGASDSSDSGLFQADVATNTSTTLVTKQQGSGTGDLFQAQNSSGSSLFKVTSAGLVGVGVSTPTVALDVGGAIQQTGMATPSSGSGSGWAELGYCYIPAQYQRCETVINILGGNDGGQSNNTQATISFRVKQQALMGSAPYVNVTLNNTAEIIKVTDLEAITTSNTCTNSPTCSAGNTTVQLWGHVEDTYEDWHYTPTLNVPDYTLAGVTWTPNNNGTGSLTATASLPSGTVTPAIYGDSFANTMTIQDSGNSTNTLQVTNSSGSNLLNADAADNTVTMLQNTAQVKTYYDGTSTNYELTISDNVVSPNESVRWRVNPYGANLEAGLVDMYLSGWSNANFSGSQYFFLRGADNNASGLIPGDTYVGDGFGTGGPIGSDGVDQGATLLVLDTGVNSNIPTEEDGGMYYNTTTQSFMCGRAGAWSSCTGLVNTETSATNTLSATGNGTWATFSSGTNHTYTLPANDCQAGVVYDITAAGLYSNIASWKVKANIYVDSLGTALTGSTPSVQDPTDGTHNASNFGWYMHATMTCYSANTYNINGTLTWDNANGETNTQALYNDSSSTLTANTSHTIGVEYYQNSSNASDTFKMYQFVVVRHGP